MSMRARRLIARRADEARRESGRRADYVRDRNAAAAAFRADRAHHFRVVARRNVSQEHCSHI